MWHACSSTCIDTMYAYMYNVIIWIITYNVMFRIPDFENGPNTFQHDDVMMSWCLDDDGDDDGDDHDDGDDDNDDDASVPAPFLVITYDCCPV